MKLVLLSTLAPLLRRVARNLIALTLCVLPWHAWSLSGPLHQLISDTWTNREGLPEGGVLSLLEDDKGQLWLGTECCLLRFDGYQFYSVEREVAHFGQFSFVRALEADRSGGFWMATAGGVGHYTQHAFEWYGPEQGLTHPFVYSLAAESDPWIGTGGDGIWRLNRGHFFRDTGYGKELPGLVNAIIKGADGLLWAATDFGLIKRAEHGLWFNHRLPNDDIFTGAKALLLDQRNTLWIAGEHGVGFLDEQGALQMIKALAGKPFYSLLADSDGFIWAGGDNQIARIQQQEVDLHPHQLGRTNALLEDRHGNLWIGANRGLSRLKRGAIATVTTADGLKQNTLYTILPHPTGGFWIIDSQGSLGHWRANTYQVLAPPGTVTGGGMLGQALDHQGALWIVNGSAQRWLDGRMTTYYLPHNDATLIEAREEGLWIGQTRADGESHVRFLPKAVIDNSTLQAALSDEKHLPIGAPIRHLQRLYFDSQGHLWLATGGTGLIRYHIASQQTKVFTEDNGLPSNFVYSLVQDSERNLWVATRSGLALVQGDNITNFRGLSGLPERSPVHLTLDEMGRLWATADDGIYVIEKASLLNRGEALPNIRKLTTRDGLLSLVVSWRRNAMTMSKGKLYFATNEGLAIADVRQTRIGSPAPKVAIAKVTLGEAQQEQERIRIGNRQEHLDIHYWAPDLNEAHRLEFQSRLIKESHPLNAPWSAPTVSRNVQFSNLAHGNYRFEVRARYSGEPWATQSATLDIAVPPHLYERTSVQLALAVFAALGATLWVRRRLRAAKWREQELRQRVEERTEALSREVDYRKTAEKAAADLARDLDLRVRERTAQLELAEMATKRSEERFALAVKGAEDGIWDWDITVNRLYLSPRWLSILGYSSGEFSANIDNWLSAVHPADVERLRDILMFGNDSSGFRLEYRMRHRKGHEVWILTRGVIVRDPQGTPIRAAGSQTDISARKATELQLLRRHTEDPVTGLPNRLLFSDRLSQALLQSRETHSGVAVIFVDIDKFRSINERFGHDIGDAVLNACALRIKECLRSIDSAARVGNDEFAILIHDVQTEQDAEKMVACLKERLNKPLTVGGETLDIHCSMGIRVGQSNDTSSHDFLIDSELALANAKSCDGEFETHELDEEAEARKQLALELEQGIEKNEFVLFYQPLIDPIDHRLVGVEALARWQHPTRGLLSPYHFIAMLETCGLIVPFSQWVLKAACAQGRAWYETLGTHISISINVPAHQLNDPNLFEEVSSALAHEALTPSDLCLEIVESSLLESQPVVIDNLKKLRNLGVKIAIDDFGTGYSAFSYLEQFPIDRVKIDRSFCQNVPDNAKASAILTALIGMINELDLEVVVEGVETQAQLDLLLNLGAPIIQGYFYSQPVSPEECVSIFDQYCTTTNQGNPATPDK